MNKALFVAAVLTTAAIGTSGAAIASASDNGKQDAIEMQALANAKLSAVNAIAAAQAEQPGKISELQFNMEKDVANYEISILAADGTEHNLMVDATSGKVTKIAANEDKSATDDDFDGDQNDQEQEGQN